MQKLKNKNNRNILETNYKTSFRKKILPFNLWKLQLPLDIMIHQQVAIVIYSVKVKQFCATYFTSTREKNPAFCKMLVIYLSTFFYERTIRRMRRL